MPSGARTRQGGFDHRAFLVQRCRFGEPGGGGEVGQLGPGLGFEPRLVRETKQYQTPWVYLRGEFVGGYNALDELQRLGQLEDRTLPPEERGKSRSRIRLEVPKRPPEDGPEGERR